MLTIKALNKTYANGVQALKDVHLQIPTGLYGCWARTVLASPR